MKYSYPPLPKRNEGKKKNKNTRKYLKKTVMFNTLVVMIVSQSSMHVSKYIKMYTLKV